MTAGLIVAGLFIVAAVLWYVRKAGADSARSGAAQDALQSVTKAEKPATEKELADVKKKYRRD